VPDRWFEKTRWWWCALSGVLLVLGFAPFAWPACGWIALVPAWWVITHSETARRQPIRHGYLIGLIYFGGTFWWISDVTPIGTLLLILYLALYPGFWFLLVARLLLPRTGTSAHPAAALFRAITAASFWVTLEWWRGWFLTGFDWNELGASQSPSIIFRQLAAFGGVSLISFVLAAVNVLWAEGLLGIEETLRRHRVVRAPFPFGAALLTVAVFFALGWHHLLRHRSETPRPGPSYACIQPNVPQIANDPNFDRNEQLALAQEMNLSAQAIKAKPDLLVWPEAILDEGVFQDRPLNDAVHSIVEDFDGYFMLGSQDFDLDAHKLYNAAYLFPPGGNTVQEYRKTRLVVLGEYLPFGDRFPQLRKWLGMGMDFNPGPKAEKFVLTKPAATFAPLICFEDTLADVAARAARLNPDFFVTITNDGWYTGWFAQWGVRQHLNLAVFRCVEHDRPMVRCANNGVSCEIDPNGTVIARLHDAAGNYIDVPGIFTRTLQMYPPHRTLYEAWGDWIVLLSALVSVMLGVYSLGRGLVFRREF
jgi:apolipoprotein N-acyltransferase